MSYKSNDKHKNIFLNTCKEDSVSGLKTTISLKKNKQNIKEISQKI